MARRLIATWAAVSQLHSSQAHQRPLELTRYRKALIRERASEVNRIQKLLETAYIKLFSVATNVLGVSGPRHAGRSSAWAGKYTCAVGPGPRLTAQKIPELEDAIEGRIEALHRFVLAQQPAHIDYLDEAIDRCNGEIARRMGPYSEAAEQLDSIPGVNRGVAEVLVAEIGVDKSVFPSPHHLASGANCFPG